MYINWDLTYKSKANLDAFPRILRASCILRTPYFLRIMSVDANIRTQASRCCIAPQGFFLRSPFINFIVTWWLQAAVASATAVLYALAVGYTVKMSRGYRSLKKLDLGGDCGGTDR